MTYRNVPDDWDCYWHTCPLCNSRYHESEGGCCECRDLADGGELAYPDPDPPEPLEPDRAFWDE